MAATLEEQWGPVGERIDVFDNAISALGLASELKASVPFVHIVGEVGGPAFLAATDAARLNHLESMIEALGGRRSMEAAAFVINIPGVELLNKFGVSLDRHSLPMLIEHIDGVLSNKGVAAACDALGVLALAMSISNFRADPSPENEYALGVDLLGFVPHPLTQAYSKGHAIGDLGLAAYKAITGRDAHEDLADFAFQWTQTQLDKIEHEQPLFGSHGAYSYLAGQTRDAAEKLGLPIPDRIPGITDPIQPERHDAGARFDVAADANARQFHAVPDDDERDADRARLLDQDDDGGAVQQVHATAPQTSMHPDHHHAHDDSAAHDHAGSDNEAAREEASMLTVQPQVNVADDGVFSQRAAPLPTAPPAPLMPDAHETTSNDGAQQINDPAAGSPMMPDADDQHHVQQVAAAAHEGDVARHDQQHFQAEHAGDAGNHAIAEAAAREQAQHQAAVVVHNAQGKQG